MSRRSSGHMNGEKYLGNVNTKEVYDIDQETVNCQIDEIIAAGNDKPYTLLKAAHKCVFLLIPYQSQIK